MKGEGAFHCGNIRYEAEPDPGMVGICHCIDCQALTGSALPWSMDNAGIPRIEPR